MVVDHGFRDNKDTFNRLDGNFRMPAFQANSTPQKMQIGHYLSKN